MKGGWLATLLLAAAYAALIAACSKVDLKELPTVGSSAGDPVIANPSFSADIQPIFSGRCAIPACHIVETEANLGLVLKDADTSYAHLVNVESKTFVGTPLVSPGNSGNSALIFMLDVKNGGTMPKQGPPLSQGTLDTIINWIDQGALKN